MIKALATLTQSSISLDISISDPMSPTQQYRLKTTISNFIEYKFYGQRTTSSTERELNQFIQATAPLLHALALLEILP